MPEDVDPNAMTDKELIAAMRNMDRHDPNDAERDPDDHSSETTAADED